MLLLEDLKKFEITGDKIDHISRAFHNINQKE